MIHDPVSCRKVHSSNTFRGCNILLWTSFLVTSIILIISISKIVQFDHHHQNSSSSSSSGTTGWNLSNKNNNNNTYSKYIATTSNNDTILMNRLKSIPIRNISTTDFQNSVPMNTAILSSSSRWRSFLFQTKEMDFKNISKQQPIKNDIKPSNNIPYKILGGNQVEEQNTYPFYVQSMGYYLCGGTLIYEDIVLTAAHCYDAYYPGAMISIGGTQADGSQSEINTIEQIYVHDTYTPGPEVNDIMLVKLHNASKAPLVKLNYEYGITTNSIDHYTSSSSFLSSLLSEYDTSSVLSQQEQQQQTQQQHATIIGYGLTSENGYYAPTLQEGMIQMYDIQKCVDYYGKNINDTTMICAGDPTGIVDSCQGDSGGPLLMKRSSTTKDLTQSLFVTPFQTRDANEDNEEMTQIGIVSFGNGCGRPGVPAVYTKISGYKEWIEKSICSISSNPPITCYVNKNEEATTTSEPILVVVGTTDNPSVSPTIPPSFTTHDELPPTFITIPLQIDVNLSNSIFNLLNSVVDTSPPPPPEIETPTITNSNVPSSISTMLHSLTTDLIPSVPAVPEQLRPLLERLSPTGESSSTSSSSSSSPTNLVYALNNTTVLGLPPSVLTLTAAPAISPMISYFPPAFFGPTSSTWVSLLSDTTTTPFLTKEREDDESKIQQQELYWYDLFTTDLTENDTYESRVGATPSDGIINSSMSIESSNQRVKHTGGEDDLASPKVRKNKYNSTKVKIKKRRKGSQGQ